MYARRGHAGVTDAPPASHAEKKGRTWEFLFSVEPHSIIKLESFIIIINIIDILSLLSPAFDEELKYSFFVCNRLCQINNNSLSLTALSKYS